jgi:hypothetical protein
MPRQTLPKCVVLQTAEGEHLGFILLAVPDGASAGDCVFMIVPRNPALLNTPQSQALHARKALGESRVQIIPSPSQTIRIQSTGLPDLIVELTPSGAGTWREAPPGTASGRAAAAATPR